MENLTKDKSNLIKMIGVLAIFACIYLVVITISEIKGYNFIGGGVPAGNVISFEGKGEVFAKPDLATISFTIRENQKEMKDAQTKVTAKEALVLNFLDKSGIDKKDIKTENYSSYPQYEYQNSFCPTPKMGETLYCPPGKQVLKGYEVSEYITVKVHDLAKAGDIVKGIGDAGVNGIDGPNFSIDNEDKLKEQARKMAIDEAKAKAEVLSRDLGVHLVRIVNFSENGNYPMPMYAKGMAELDSVISVSAPAPALPTGENKIISNVTITYEIR